MNPRLDAQAREALYAEIRSRAGIRQDWRRLVRITWSLAALFAGGLAVAYYRGSFGELDLLVQVASLF